MPHWASVIVCPLGLTEYDTGRGNSWEKELTARGNVLEGRNWISHSTWRKSMD